MPYLVIVLLALVTNCSNHHLLRVEDMKQSHVTGGAEWNDQFAFEPVVVGDAASKRVGFQNPEFAANGRDRPAWQVEVPVRQRRFNEEVFQAKQVLQSFTRERDIECHERPAWARFAGASLEMRASRRFCIASSASLAE